MEEKQCCKDCGSLNLEVKVWQNINTGEIESTVDESDIWCADCEEFTEIVYLKDYKPEI